MVVELEEMERIQKVGKSVAAIPRRIDREIHKLMDKLQINWSSNLQPLSKMRTSYSILLKQQSID